MMTADATSVGWMGNRRDGDDDSEEKERGGEKRTDIVTLDLLGGCGSKELLDRDVLKLPTAGVAGCGNEGTYSSCSRSNQLEFINSIMIPRAPDLDLKLSPPSTGCQSVCTLDKVRFSLERLKKNKEVNAPTSSTSSPTSNSTTTTTSTKHEKKRTRRDSTDPSSSEEEAVVHTVSGGERSLLCCPLCSSYIFVTEANSRCSRCESSLPLLMPKKHKTEIVTGGDFSGF